MVERSASRWVVRGRVQGVGFRRFVLRTARGLGLAGWVYFARVVRGIVLQEMQKDYVKAAQVLGASRIRVGLRYVFPNVLPAIAVIATLQLPALVIFEATLSFLGVGMPPTQPSLGTLISEGQNFLLSGEWWISLFPGAALVLLVLSVNMVGDWLRDALNPKLR